MAKQKGPVKIAVTGHFDHPTFYQQLGNRIVMLRKKRGFSSYEAFAYEIGISRSMLSKYESGIIDNLEMKSLLKVIDGLGMTPGQFFSEGFD